ncbi:uncharacterized protein LOC143274759 isoform X2 [Babylonia areolata]
MYCGQHQQVLCALCACTHHRACPDLTPLTQAAPTFREHVTGRVLSLTNTLANMAGQTDHVRNEFRDLKRRLQNRFQDLHLDLNRRQDDLAMMIQAQEDLAFNSLTEAHGDRHFLKVVSSSLAKIAETAPDDVLMARRKSLTSQLDDAEKKPDVTSEIRTGKLTFDEAKMSHLKSQIGKLGHFEGDTVPKTNKCRPKPQSIRVKVPGAVDALIQAEDQSVKATGAELARRLRVGHRVKRSSQWMSEDKDGGSPDAQGTVRHVGTVSVVRGMVQCGKTVICNFLADATEVSGGDYRPTQGVRILEFEVNGLSVPGRSSVDVELWDCSGDNKFEACWPAITQDAMGVIFVYNPDQPNHDQDLEKWYKFFGSQKSVKINGCMVFEHHKPNASEVVRTELPSGFSKMPRVSTNIEEDPDSVRNGFNKFLEMIVAAISRHREKEELSIMNQ